MVTGSNIVSVILSGVPVLTSSLNVGSRSAVVSISDRGFRWIGVRGRTRGKLDIDSSVSLAEGVGWVEEEAVVEEARGDEEASGEVARAGRVRGARGAA